MKEADEIRKQEQFEERLKKIQQLSYEEKTALMEVELYYQGIFYANDGVPYEEIEHMRLSNEEAFMRGYNETMEKKIRCR